MFDDLDDSGDEEKDESRSEGASGTSSAAGEESETDASMSHEEASSPQVNPGRTSAMEFYLFSSAHVEAEGSRQLSP